MSNPHSLTPFPARREDRPAPRDSQTKKPAIKIAEPYPLLDPGDYVALCTEATYAWTRQFGGWKARLTLEPQDYEGRPYTGKLCKFLGLGKSPDAPYAGPRSDFRALLVEVNGAQPTSSDVDMKMGRFYRITVETVNRNRKGEPLGTAFWYSTVRAIHPVAPSTPVNPCNSGNPGNPPTD